MPQKIYRHNFCRSFFQKWEHNALKVKNGHFLHIFFKKFFEKLEMDKNICPFLKMKMKFYKKKFQSHFFALY